jgi:hypothetical protein
MTTRTSRLWIALCCILTLSGLAMGLASAEPGAAGEIQKKAAAQADPARRPPPESAPKETPDAAALGERVDALEKENVVLREDMGKARLDARTHLRDLEEQQAEADARLRQRIDELEAQLAAERERQSRRERNLWLALGVLAIGILASD